MCNSNVLETESSRLTHPIQNYKELSIDRFYDLDRNAQKPIFWNFSINSKLEAIDNYVMDCPVPMKQDKFPAGFYKKVQTKQCRTVCN